MDVTEKRLAKMFADLRGKRAALITYATGYFPDREGSLSVIETMLDSGADAVEIGIPFSDPVMDGPVIQETSATALGRARPPGACSSSQLKLAGEPTSPFS